MNTIPFFGKEFNTFIPVLVLLMAILAFSGEKRHHRERRESESRADDVEVSIFLDPPFNSLNDLLMNENDHLPSLLPAIIPVLVDIILMYRKERRQRMR